MKITFLHSTFAKTSENIVDSTLTLLHSKRSKFYGVLAILGAKGLNIYSSYRQFDYSGILIDLTLS